VLGGCATYHETSLEALTVGGEVRARLSDSGSRRLEEVTAGNDSDQVDGTLAGVGADSLVLEVWRSDLVTGGAFRPGRVRVPFQRGEVIEIQERRVSYLRTGVLLGAVVVAGAVLISESIGGGRAGGQGGGGGPEITLLPRRLGSFLSSLVGH